MHIPDGFLTPAVWGAFDVVGAAAVAVGLYQTSKSLQEKAVPMMGVLSAFVFAAQMLNVPVSGGTSGHFLGGALVGIVLGPWTGLVVMAIILSVQCLVFQDGGIAALGANIFNMGILGCWLSAYLFRLMHTLWPGTRGRFCASFTASWLTILLASLSCAAQLTYSGVVSMKLAVVVIGGVHSILGLVEGLVTATVIASLARTRPDLLNLAEPGKIT